MKYKVIQLTLVIIISAFALGGCAFNHQPQTKNYELRTALRPLAAGEGRDLEMGARSKAPGLENAHARTSPPQSLDFEELWHKMTKTVELLLDIYLQLETALKVIREYTLETSRGPPISDIIYQTRGEHGTRTKALKEFLTLLPEVQAWQRDTQDFPARFDTKQVYVRRDKRKIISLIKLLNTKISAGRRYLDKVSMFDNIIQRSHGNSKAEVCPRSAGQEDPVIETQATQVLERQI